MLIFTIKKKIFFEIKFRMKKKIKKLKRSEMCFYFLNKTIYHFLINDWTHFMLLSLFNTV